MSNKFGLFVNLNYASKPKEECSLIWEKITDKMLDNGFAFDRRAFIINTDQNMAELKISIKVLLDEIQKEQTNFYGFIMDCFLLDVKSCNDLILPYTIDSIEVKHIGIEDFEGAMAEVLELQG